MMWSEKYRVKDVYQFIGNEQSRLEVLKWIKNWIKGTKPILIMGPPGTGKTSFIISMANFFNYDIVELNASDFRNKANLESIIHPLLNNSSIFGKNLLLFLDEVDGISGREDTGGLTFLISTLKDSNIPIIMAANSKNPKIKELIKSTKLVEFLPLSSFASYLLLQIVLAKEHKFLDMDQKLLLIEKSNGDARTLLNLAQSKLEGKYDPNMVNSAQLPIDECINLFFSVNDISEAKNVLNKSDILYAIFSSIVANEKKISLIDMAKILDELSKVDLYINKIYNKQNWHLLRYANDVLVSTLFDITRNIPIRYSQYNIPFPLIGSIFIRGQSTRFLGKSLSKIFHTSLSNIGMFYTLPLLSILKDHNYQQILFNTQDDDKLNEVITKEKERIRRK